MQILFGISLEVHEKEIVSVIGANGAGKTTTLATISGIINPKRGRIRFLNTPIDHMDPHGIVQLGIIQVPEGRRVFPSLTVMENLELGSFNLRAKQRRRESLQYILSLFPVLKERQHQIAGSLSGGQQQMLAIGRALMGLPKLLLMDEPSLGLAPLVADQIYEVIQNLKRESNTPILLVEQNVVQALEISDRAYVYSNGRIVLQGASRGLFDNPDIQRAYFGKNQGEPLRLRSTQVLSSDLK
jgi:branched-chain amino acid transport system ATP-binding protein